MMDLSRRMLICGGVALGVKPAVAAGKQEAHRYRTTDFHIEMTVEYHDRYNSSGFWFRERISNRAYCLSGAGEESRGCLTNFRGSLAIARYKVRSRSQNKAAPRLRELVRTIDRDPRLNDRPAFERGIELKTGIGSDLQAFGYEPAPGEESMLEEHGPWYLFRQDLFLEAQRTPFLVIFWKHALPSIRMLDLIPGEQTWPVTK